MKKSENPEIVALINALMEFYYNGLMAWWDAIKKKQFAKDNITALATCEEKLTETIKNDPLSEVIIELVKQALKPLHALLEKEKDELQMFPHPDYYLVQYALIKIGATITWNKWFTRCTVYFSDGSNLSYPLNETQEFIEYESYCQADDEKTMALMEQLKEDLKARRANEAAKLSQ